MRHLKWWFLLAGICPVLAFAASNSATHNDPITSVILGVTSIFFFAIVGRYSARLLHQPSVLGELLMGVLVGNVCYFFGMQLAVILREGSAIFNIMRDMLAGIPLLNAVNKTISNPHDAAKVMTALSKTTGTK